MLALLNLWPEISICVEVAERVEEQKLPRLLSCFWAHTPHRAWTAPGENNKLHQSRLPCSLRVASERGKFQEPGTL